MSEAQKPKKPRKVSPKPEPVDKYSIRMSVALDATNTDVIALCGLLRALTFEWADGVAPRGTAMYDFEIEGVLAPKK